MFACHKDLVRLVSSGSLDPQRARKATEETRDAVFTKLDCYVKSLHAMGKVSWEGYKDVPKQNIYNMDEAATDTTKHRSKVIADALSMVCSFAITPEDNGKINMHISVCLTTHADGIFHDSLHEVEGACGPLIIHTDKSKTKEKQMEE